MKTAASLCLIALSAAGQGPLVLPTANDALYRGEGPDFFQYVERDFEGEKSRPWQGGQFGFVRNPSRLGSSIVYTRFHEGIDIRPVDLDPAGVPRDVVRAIDAGRVVFVNRTESHSNYGIYVVVEHRWENSPVYALYAHLRSASAEPGQTVPQGGPLGVMGWSGSGLDRARAHLHLEINLFLNTRFEEWHALYFRDSPNRNGIYNGLNMIGLDPASFLLAKRADPALTLSRFLRQQEVFFRVLVPGRPMPQILSRYPWLIGTTPAGAPRGWEIHFTRAGLPVRAEPSATPVTAPRLVGVRSAPHAYASLTRGLIAGSAGSGRLSESGQRYLHLILFPEGTP